ncbi:MAG: acyltransferase family protein, partial [Butyrivibrio sp.]|nr:acyltransferase family protein [Butyrivibrio sp.]
DMAVAIFIIAQLFIPITYSARQYLLCWIGWESVGNSNWFIFVILSLYLIALFALWIQQKTGFGGIVITILLIAGLWIWLRLIVHQPSWWVDTMAAFPLGMVVSRYKEYLLGLLNKKGVPFILTGCAVALFTMAYITSGIDIYGVVTCLFCCMVMLISSLVKIGNPILDWLGKNAFTIYIIQRLPMIVFSSLGLNTHNWLFVLLVIPATFILAELLSKVNQRIDNCLFAHV